MKDAGTGRIAPEQGRAGICMSDEYVQKRKENGKQVK